jgi:hypothetical protein
MRWVKHGLVFEPNRQAPWVGTHAALPVLHRAGDVERLYFSSRDASNRSHIGFTELSSDPHDRSGDTARAPALSPGALGAFDDAGVTSASIVDHGGRLYLFYTGWSLGVTVPFYLNAGLAVSDDGGARFYRVSPAPLLDRSTGDPYLTASPWVLLENGLWRMWYVSGSEWRRTPQGPQHRYRIKYAESRDGATWDRRGVVCIDYASDEEVAFGRPCVVRDGDRYRMWYSYRGAQYRIGYAESSDGITWQRNDSECILERSSTGWDSEMVTYPVVLRSGREWRMLYNGNGYGRSGVGLAIGRE